MRFEGYDDELPDEEQVLDEFMGDRARARELRQMRSALEHRLTAMIREREHTADLRERIEMDGKIGELKKQVDAIQQEEAITSFVEGSVRATLHRPSSEEL